MYELIKLTEKTYYIESPAKVGIVLIDKNKVALIDSGNDKDAGKKILKVLNANGWELSAIFNTHYHADHIGGNAYLQAQTGCRIYAPDVELAFIEAPLLEPSLLFGGNPPPELRHKFLMAQPSKVLPLTDAVIPDGMEIIPLGGHSFNMVGFRTSDNVLFLADCLSSAATLEKYKIGFITDIGEYLSTLDRVMNMQASVFVPSHAEATCDISALARLNADKVHEIADTIFMLCNEPITFDSLLKKVFDRFGLTMSFEQYALVGSTVRSYITYLKNNGKLTAAVSDNSLLWQSVK